jgi:hypothetical protein
MLYLSAGPSLGREPQTCSRATAHWLNVRDLKGDDRNIIKKPTQVFCQDFKRLGLISFRRDRRQRCVQYGHLQASRRRLESDSVHYVR